MAELERTRLHITPFNSSLFNTIIPQSVQPAATGLSYHTIQTFPERAYGFVELPKIDAEKLRKKLNGMTLKGAKMRVEEAKPEKRKRTEAVDGEVEAETEDKPKKRSKKHKSKKKDGEIEGFELPVDRHVKRGWTEESGKKEKTKEKSADKKARKSETSKYIRGKEVLFKTTLPHHSTPVIDAPVTTTTTPKDKKDKKAKYVKGPTVIHEFERTKKHASFLRSEATSTNGIATDFVDGKGWVDADGNLVEAVKTQSKREDRLARISEVPVKLQTGERANAIRDSINSSGRATTVEVAKVKPEAEAKSEDISSDSSGDISSVSSDSSEEESEDEPSIGSDDESKVSAGEMTPRPQATVPETSIDFDTSAQAESTPPPLTESANSLTPPKDVHPLEALFKRPKPTGTPRPAPINTSFNFFDAADDDNADEEADRLNDMMPQTPYSRTRDTRSAAPTPDTAAIGRRFSFFHDKSDADEEAAYVPQSEYADQIVDMGGWGDGDEEDVNQIPVANKAKDEAAGNGESDFAKWFWENRGDTNRAWKKRRREVLKVKRQRENRRLGRKVV